MSQVILRPVFNRPEMLQLSIEYEVLAREYFMLPGEFITVFLIEYGSPQKTIDLIKEYPFEKKIILRTEQYGLSKNILEGMKEAFGIANDYIIYVEDDILIHKTYFKYMNILLNMDIVKFSILSPFNNNNKGSINEVYRGHHYAALAPLITKKFFNDYIVHCINSSYYASFNSRAKFVGSLDKNFINDSRYKYKKPVHNEQAGLINRLVDIAMIQDDMYVIMPKVNRQIHIGYYGKNRPGNLIGNSYEERLDNLKSIIKENKFYEMTRAKMYNDYLIFDDRLNKWDETLYLKG